MTTHSLLLLYQRNTGSKYILWTAVRQMQSSTHNWLTVELTCCRSISKKLFKSLGLSFLIREDWHQKVFRCSISSVSKCLLKRLKSFKRLEENLNVSQMPQLLTSWENKAAAQKFQHNWNISLNAKRHYLILDQ